MHEQLSDVLCIDNNIILSETFANIKKKNYNLPFVKYYNNNIVVTFAII